jgi:hypothetical protein
METYLHTDVFLFCFVDYKIDPPPNVWQLPSSNASLTIGPLPLFWGFVLSSCIVLICLGTICFLKASKNIRQSFKLGLLGCLLSACALIPFVSFIFGINQPLGFVGAISSPVWIDWGPDVGFYLALFSITMGAICTYSIFRHDQTYKEDLLFRD